MNGENGGLDKLCVSGWGNAIQCRQILLPSQSRRSMEKTSEIIWSSPLIFQKSRNFGIVPRDMQKNVSGNV